MPGELQEVWRDGAWYIGRVEDARTDESGSGTPGILLSIICTEGEMLGKYIHDDHWISRNNADNQRDVFKKVFDYDITNGNNDADVTKLVGKELQFKIKYEPGFGRDKSMKPKIARLRKLGENPGLSPGKRIAAFFGTPTPEVQEGDEFDPKKFEED
jgi:hypothetical protein